MTLSPVPLQASEPPPVVIKDTIYSNCWLYVRSRVIGFPNTKDMEFIDIPRKGGAGVMYFDGKAHYFESEEIVTTGIEIGESNFGGDFINHRFVTFEYLKEHNVKYIKLPADNI